MIFRDLKMLVAGTTVVCVTAAAVSLQSAGILWWYVVPLLMVLGTKEGNGDAE